MCGTFWCWLIPAIVGIACGILGYLLGKTKGDRWRVKYDEAQSNLNTAKKLNVKLENDLKACRKKSADFDAKLSSLQAEKDSEIEAWKLKFGNLEGDLATTKNSLASIDADGYKSTIENLEAKLKTSNDSNTKLKADLDACRNDKSKNGEWEAKIATLTTDLTTSKNQFADLQGNLGAKDKRIAELEEQLRLANEPKETFDADVAKAVFGKKIKLDDLKVVEGIGPKIEGLFHEHGIKTWKALSEASIEKCQEVLNSGGDRYRIHNPGTWPAQAKFAYEGKWAELLKWQDELDGGK